MSHAELQAEFLRQLSAGTAPDLLIRSLLERSAEDPEFHTKVVASLLNINLDEEAAREVLTMIVERHQDLVLELCRPVDLRVAALEFALDRRDLMSTPVVVERGVLDLTQRLAALDELTGLFNRRFLEIYLTKELNRAQRHREVFSVLFLDLDNFKRVNDTRGHDVGDAVLREFAVQTSALLRKEDFAARYGGEEFVVVLPHTDTAGALQFSSRLAAALSAVRIAELDLTFSGGISTFPDHGETVDSLLRNADVALYHAKANGKDQVHVSDAEKRRSPRHRIDLPAYCYAGGQELGQVRLRDVSVKGVSMQAETFLDPGQTVRFRIMTGTGQGASEYEVFAQVVWTRKLGEVSYQIGGRWARADEEVLDFLVSQAADR